MNQGQIFENSDCAECFCLGGGRLECVPKQCPSCPAPAQFSQVSLSCRCFCKECGSDQFLCQTSKVCIPMENVCDGVEHCLDDERDCDAPSPLDPSDQRFSFDGSLCPAPQCRPGTTPVETEVETLNGCPFYKCLNRNTAPTCPTPTCPPGYEVKMVKERTPFKLTEEENVTHRDKRYAIIEEELDCPRYDCVEIESEPEDRNCSYLGNSLTTLDNMVARSDLCHHTLLQTRDLDFQIECKCRQ